MTSPATDPGRISDPDEGADLDPEVLQRRLWGRAVAATATFWAGVYALHWGPGPGSIAVVVVVGAVFAGSWGVRGLTSSC